MSTEAEDLLLQALSEDETSGPVTLTVNEKTRLIEYDGELLLGVEDDDNSEKIFFVMPKLVGNNDLIDASASDVEVFIIYKNAINNTYKQQCTDVTVDGDNVKFSWLLTRYATEAKGNVSFMVCVQKLGTDTEGKSVILNEWHTTPFKGTVLVGIDTDHTTPEVLPANSTASTAQLRAEVDALSQKIDDAIIGYSKTEIDAMFADYTYDEADANTAGVVKLGYTENGQNYPVEKDSNGNIYANVPWTDIKVKQTYSSADTGKHPLLFSDTSIDAFGTAGASYTGVARVNPLIWVLPASGQITAQYLVATSYLMEGTTKLSDKYAPKDKTLTITFNSSTPTTGSTTTYIQNNASTDTDIDANSDTNTLNYVKYTFAYNGDYLSILQNAKYIEFLHESSVYRLPVTSTRRLTVTGSSQKLRVQVNATYTDNVPGGTCLNRTYYFAINMQYAAGSTANFTIYREGNSKMTWLGITEITIGY